MVAHGTLKSKPRKHSETVGDVLPGLIKDHDILLEKAMDKHNPTHDKPYFILMVADWEGDALKTKAIIMPARPPVDLIATMLYEVDPTSGEYKMLYCKPRDIPSGHIILNGKSTSVLDVIAQNNFDSFTPIIH